MLTAWVGTLENNQFLRLRLTSLKSNAFVSELTKSILFIFNETVSKIVLREEDSNQ